MENIAKYLIRYNREDREALAETRDGETIMIQACKMNCPVEIIWAVYDKKTTKLDASDRWGNTALGLAEKNKNFAVVRFLKSVGASVSGAERAELVYHQNKRRYDYLVDRIKKRLENVGKCHVCGKAVADDGKWSDHDKTPASKLAYIGHKSKCSDCKTFSNGPYKSNCTESNCFDCQYFGSF